MGTRRERVILDIESDLAATLVRDAAAAKLLARELNSLGRQSVETSRASQSMARDSDTIARSADKADTSINKLTGRLRVMSEVAAILGPALVPVGAVAVPAIAGLANQLGAAALAGGAATLAFQGVGDALKAVNTAALEPTAANLEAARLAMEQLSPAARDMVRELQGLRPVLAGLRDTAAEGMFPGLIDGLDELESRLPDVERVISHVSTTLGSLMRDAGTDLASDRWTEFFHFLSTEASTTLVSMGKVVGGLTHGLAELWMAFDPLNDDFSGWLEDVASGFDSWASGLAQTEGFRAFIDYVRTSGPQVADTFAALGDAVLQIVEASAPLGGPVLHGLESVAKVIGAIADSDLGTPIMTAVTAMSLLNRAQGTYKSLAATTWGGAARANVVGMGTALTTVVSAQQRATMSASELARAEAQRSAAMRGGMVTLGKGAAAAGALAIAFSGAGDSIGLANTAMFGLVGGPWGAAVGLMLDLKAATNDVADAIDAANDALDSGSVDKMRVAYSALLDTMKANDPNSLIAAQFDIGAQVDKLLNLDVKGLLKSGPLGTIGSLIRGQTDEGIAALQKLEEAIHSATHPSTSKSLGQILTPGLGLTRAAFDAATQSAEEFRASLAKVSAALDGRADFRDFKAAIDDYRNALEDATKSGKDFLNANKTGFRTSINLGREMEAALDNIASSSLAVAENMKGMARARYLDQARDQFINAARAAGITKKAAADLADQFGLVDRIKAQPKVDPQGIPETHRDVDGVQKKFNILDGFTAKPGMDAQDHASGPISWVQNALANLNGDTATVRIIAQRVGNFDLNPFGAAAGGTVGALAAGGPVRTAVPRDTDRVSRWFEPAQEAAA